LNGFGFRELLKSGLATHTDDGEVVEAYRFGSTVEDPTKVTAAIANVKLIHRVMSIPPHPLSCFGGLRVGGRVQAEPEHHAHVSWERLGNVMGTDFSFTTGARTH
jgi:hypothetical protein